MPDDLRDEIKTMMVENLMLKVAKEEIGNDLPLFSPEGLGLDSIDALELVVSRGARVVCSIMRVKVGVRARGAIPDGNEAVPAVPVDVDVANVVASSPVDPKTATYIEIAGRL